MSLDSGIPVTMNVQPSGSGNGNGWGFGGEGSWFIILFLIFAMFGWGGYGFGGNRGGDGAANGYVLATDFANIERKLDGVNSGICDGFYAMNTGMLNGFANVTQAVNQGFSQAEIARCNAQMAFMQQFFSVQQQISNCCCENREAIAQVRYDMATQACDTRNAVNTAARDIIENNNANSRALMDYLVSSKMQDLQTENQSLKLAASQAAQNNYLINALRPSPTPAYITCNPWASSPYGGCCCAA